ncbi:MAG: hypothetical protein Q8N58_00990 [bacterium]|nr:hypothetical protein [bacterium]
MIKDNLYPTFTSQEEDETPEEMPEIPETPEETPAETPAGDGGEVEGGVSETPEEEDSGF